jgi:hypothetical protein
LMAVTEVGVALGAFLSLVLIWMFLPGRGPAEAHGITANGAAGNGAWRLQVSSVDVGGALGMRIERNPDFDGRAEDASPRFFVLTDLSGLNGMRKVRVPVFWRMGGGPGAPRKETYTVQIAGMTVEAGNLIALEADVAKVLLHIMQRQRLPHFWLVPPNGESIPVIRHEAGYAVYVPRGPQFAARTLAKIRDHVHQYLLALGMIAADDAIGIVALGADLRQVAPLAIYEAAGIWLPVFEVEGRLRVEGLDLPVDGMEFRTVHDLLRARNAVAASLVRAGRLPSGEHLVVAHISDAAWPEILGQSAPSEHVLAFPDPSGHGRHTVPVLRLGDAMICIPNGVRRLFAGSDLWRLADVVGLEMERRGAARRGEVGVLRVGLTPVGVR